MMIDPVLSQVVQEIHAVDCGLVLEFAGAGSLALAWLHSQPGSSRTILEATDRYSPASLSDLLGHTPPTFVSPETAAAMAEEAYLRAARLSPEDHPWIGVGFTATIATDHPKRGDHRAVVAVRDRHALSTFDLTLTKGNRDRAAEEDLVSRLLLSAIARGVGVEDPLPLELSGDEQVDQQSTLSPDPMTGLWEGSSLWVTVHPDGRRVSDEPVMGVVFCGSFNPLHFGHESLAAAAKRLTGEPVTFELAAVNADKSPISRAELERRLVPFHRRHRIAVSRTPLFADKAQLYPGCTFLMGYDTAVRLIDPRFYTDAAARDAALAAIKSAGCHVIVAGREEAGKFKTFRDLILPPSASKLFIELPASEFRADICATDLRVPSNSPPAT